MIRIKTKHFFIILSAATAIGFQNCSSGFDAVRPLLHIEHSSLASAPNNFTLGNSLKLPATSEYLPLYSVKQNCTDKISQHPKAMAFKRTNSGVDILSEKGELLLFHPLTVDAYLFGGFDFDGDGCPDLGVNRSQDSGRMCGEHKILSTRIEFLNSQTGVLYAPTVALDGLCWEFPGTSTKPYPTNQWTDLSILFGSGTTKLAVLPYYATIGWYFGFTNNNFVSESHFYFPSTISYDEIYMNDKENAYKQGHSYSKQSHVANGLILNVGGEERLVFFTSNRVVQYKVGPINAQQLIADTPFLTNNRTDLVGRNYGRIQRDKFNDDNLILVAGTTAYYLFTDMQNSALGKNCADASCLSDQWGAIERHLTIYNLKTAKVEDRYFSYAHDNNGSFKFDKRIVYANNGLVKTGHGASRIAFNEYRGGHWHLHITEPGSTVDKYDLQDEFLWDIQDLDGDGVEEWVISPTRFATDPDVPGWYYPKWQTNLYHWNEATLTLDLKQIIMGAIPYLTPHFRDPESTSSYSFLYPVSTIRSASATKMLMMTPDAPTQVKERDIQF